MGSLYSTFLDFWERKKNKRLRTLANRIELADHIWASLLTPCDFFWRSMNFRTKRSVLHHLSMHAGPIACSYSTPTCQRLQPVIVTLNLWSIWTIWMLLSWAKTYIEPLNPNKIGFLFQKIQDWNMLKRFATSAFANLPMQGPLAVYLAAVLLSQRVAMESVEQSLAQQAWTSFLDIPCVFAIEGHCWADLHPHDITRKSSFCRCKDRRKDEKLPPPAPSGVSSTVRRAPRVLCFRRRARNMAMAAGMSSWRRVLSIGYYPKNDQRDRRMWGALIARHRLCSIHGDNFPIQWWRGTQINNLGNDAYPQLLHLHMHYFC